MCMMLKLQGHKTLQCCRYSVMPKTKKCLEDIDSFIKKHHRDDCGIIYCLSKMDCEKVAGKLQVYSLKFTLFCVQSSRRVMKLKSYANYLVNFENYQYPPNITEVIMRHTVILNVSTYQFIINLVLVDSILYH